MKRPTLVLAATSMACTSIIQALAALHATDEKIILSNTIGSGVCGIALLHYYWLTQPGVNVMANRYSDWVLTLPLLLLDIFIICGIDVIGNILFFLLSCILIFGMLIAGWKSIRAQNNHPNNSTLFKTWMTIGFLCLIAVYWIVLGMMERTKDGTIQTVTIGLFLLWPIYGVVAACFPTGKSSDKDPEQYAYDILDIASKAILGLVVASGAFFSQE
jgi:bacteriorhodopsin